MSECKSKGNEHLYILTGGLFIMMIMYMVAFHSMRSENEELKEKLKTYEIQQK